MLKLIFILLSTYLSVGIAKDKGFDKYTANLEEAFMKNSIQTCVDDNDSYPYYFFQDNEVLGIHVDMVRDAIIKENISISFIRQDFATCMKMVRSGEIDAILDVSYTKERAKYILYPDNTEEKQDKISNPIYKNLFEKNAIGAFDYVVITGVNNKYEFNGDPRTLPVPIRVVQDYVIIDYLESFDLNLTKNKSSLMSFQNLYETKIGCVVDLRSAAQSFNQQPSMRNYFNIHPELIYRENLYLGFSKKTQSFDNRIARIWSNIEKLRDDSKYMRNIAAKYSEK